MKKKILIVDDSLTQLTSMKIVLQRAGYNVVTASNGTQGIYSTFQEYPDLIVSDIVMPEINGYQLCRLLKNDAITRDIPIILLTSLNEKIDKFWGLKAGAEAFYTKDGKFELLIKEIENLLEKAPKVTDEQKKTRIEEQKMETVSIQSKINQLLDQSLIESTIINEFRTLSEYMLDKKVLNKKILSLIYSVLDYNIAGVFFNDKDDKKERLLIFNVNDINVNDELLKDVKKLFFFETFGKDYIEYENLYNYELVSQNDSSVSEISSVSEFKSCQIIPIEYEGKILGGICLYHVSSNKYESSKILNLVIDELKILMRMMWLYSETKFLAIIDGLTNLYNRRYFQQALDREFARARRYKHELSLFMLDIDHFKNLNDNYGHQFGDKVLSEVSRIVRDSLRKTDYIARYGGEEIVAILPETSYEKSLIPVERIRQKIEQFDFKCGAKSVQVTVSIGIAGYNSDMTSEAQLVEKADQALYSAKQNGRNRVELCTF